MQTSDLIKYIGEFERTYNILRFSGESRILATAALKVQFVECRRGNVADLGNVNGANNPGTLSSGFVCASAEKKSAAVAAIRAPLL